MVGEVLYPLNQLAAVNSKAYAFQKSKYAAREAALDFRIPGIDLLLGDTVHCASVHPYCVFRARTEAGIDITIHKAGSWLTGMFFAIPLERIMHHPVVWYSATTLWINGAPGEDVPAVAPADEFEPFDPARYRELPDVPETHVAYLRRMKERGQRPLMFVHVPHVFVAGPIDVSGLRPLPWDQPPESDDSESVEQPVPASPTADPPG
jgi:hypothetical protein